MLTPRFSLSQDDQFLTVTIYAPFTHIDQTEIFMDGEDFRFSSPPYFLRLHLPGEVTESESASGTWEADTTSFVVKCPKVKVGEHFEDLDCLTKLLSPKGATDIGNNIELLDDENDHGDEEGEEEEINWFITQTIPEEETTGVLKESRLYGYGFGGRHVDVFSKLTAEFGNLLDLENVDNTTYKHREKARLDKETADFCSSHYLCDLFESVDEIGECLAYKQHWEDISPHDDKDPALAFSPTEQEQLLSLPRKKLIVTKEELAGLHLGLADILFGICYNLRINQGTDCVETGWCVAKLSPSLSCCSRLRSPHQLVTSNMRRCLVYPLFRNWDLGLAVWNDVISLLRLGRPLALKLLLSLIPEFTSTPGYYIFNQLYINDYCIWIQSVPTSHLVSLADNIRTSLGNLTKDDVDLDLVELEEAAKITIEEEEGREVANVLERLGQVNLNVDSDDSSDESSDDSDDDSDDSDVGDQISRRKTAETDFSNSVPDKK